MASLHLASSKHMPVCLTAWIDLLTQPPRQHPRCSAPLFSGHINGNPHHYSASPHLCPRPKSPQREVAPRMETRHTPLHLNISTQKGPRYPKKAPPIPQATISNFDHHSSQPCSSFPPTSPRNPKEQACYANTPISCPCSLPTNVSTCASPGLSSSL